jgi:hypothetical protein
MKTGENSKSVHAHEEGHEDTPFIRESTIMEVQKVQKRRKCSNKSTESTENTENAVMKIQ